MHLNPLSFAGQVNKQYLRYQLTSARIGDEMLTKQFENKLWTRHPPLFKGPYISLSRAFAEGARKDTLIDEGLLHNKMRQIIRYDRVYKHQEDALRAVANGNDVLVTTGTGSGKTEAFLYPIISRILRMNEDPNVPRGVVALLVYPMNALATDQLERLREYLVGTGVTFGLYTGDTPKEASELPFQGEPLPPGTTRETYKKLRSETKDPERLVHLPHEERYTRKQIQDDPPRILIVNKAILEYQLTRGDDLSIFNGAPIEFIVMDEAHTNTGAYGTEVAMLLRRVKALAKPPSGRITHLATSATIVDEKHEDEGSRFMARLFGVPKENVVTVRETYKGVVWPEGRARTTPPPDPGRLLQEALDAVGMEPGAERDLALEAVFHELTGTRLPEGPDAPARLHEGLRGIELAYQIQAAASDPLHLDKLVQNAWAAAGRDVPMDGAKEELVTYLVLGAAATIEDAPLFRPKIHYFVKGLEGAVVTLSKGDASRAVHPELHLNAEDARKKYEGRRDPTAFFPIYVCPQCGQHHYEQYLQGVTSGSGEPLRGGEEMDGGVLFPPDPARTEGRVFFTDRIVTAQDDEENGGGTKRHEPAQVCFACGALHTGSTTTCQNCERPATLLPVLVLNEVERVKSCPVCQYNQGYGSRYAKDPFRALREVPVANVYVLAQDMLNQAPPENQSLIVFADNRQEAAFQAGWMQDRARRYRFRQLMHRRLVPASEPVGPTGESPVVSLDDLIDTLTQELLKDKTLGKAIASEAFQEFDNPFDTRLRTSLKRFLSVQVLREVAASYNTRASLEAWGRLQVHYYGLEPDNSEVEQIAARFNLDPKNLVSWIANLLDSFRKRQMLHHEGNPIFSHYWDQRRDLTKNRYLPPIDFHPSGMRLERSPGEDTRGDVKVWIGRGLTAAKDWTRALTLEEDDRDEFLRAVWKLITSDLELLVSLRALHRGDGKTAIPGTQNVYHVNGHRVGLTRQAERYQCSFCGRLQARATPDGACTRYRCKEGHMEPVEDKEPRDYDLVLLDTADTFVIAAEHTAQVPREQRLKVEQQFKKKRGVNTLVATPTLELGVDIGALDMVLLRNVPPRPANYWQRAGRAGREHRMAVIYTYARAIPHDMYFFNDPSAMLGGPITPPRFNLQNPVMVRKHVHAAVLTQIHLELQQAEAEENWLKGVIPPWIGQVVLHEGQPRESLEPVVRPLREALEDPVRQKKLLEALEATFTRDWPEDPKEVDPQRLKEYVHEMPDQLITAYERILHRLQWAHTQMRRLAAKEAQGEVLTQELQRFKDRCMETVRSFNPNLWNKKDRKRYQQKRYTLGVLSQEGFLPGHASSTGQVVASAERAYGVGWDSFEFDLPRPPAIAIHEHIPGNQIYANAGKYQLQRYTFPAKEEVKAPYHWIANLEEQEVRIKEEAKAGFHDPAALEVPSLPLVDSYLRFISHVEDLETTRFRMPSVVLGHLRPRHKGGHAYTLGDKDVQHRHGQLLTLVNLGPAKTDDPEKIGFPVCRVCGAVRSPYEKEDRIDSFKQYHKEHCQQEPDRFALHVDTTVDGLLFRNLESQPAALSLGEALCVIGAHLFEMERDDLRVLHVRLDGSEHGLFLYDPMPGGSGLLEQLLENWQDVIGSARKLLDQCPGGCPTACYDCLLTYYNQFHHEQLDRHTAIETLTELKDGPKDPAIIEPLDEVPLGKLSGDDTNIWEKRLQQIVTEEWGFTGFEPQVRVELPSISAHTIPDLGHKKVQIAIYLDGPSHNEVKEKERDRYLRGALKSMGWEVISIPIADFENDQMMGMYRQIISNALAKS